MQINKWYLQNEFILNELFTIFVTIATNNGIDMYKNEDSFCKFLHIIYNNAYSERSKNKLL